MAQQKKAHFIGIGGVGMSAVAKLLKDSDWVVTGSDEAVYPPISTQLAHYGIVWKSPYSPNNIPQDADLIVVGKNAKLVPETNTEVAAAFASGIPIKSFPEVLGDLSHDKETIAVVGSLEVAGADPSYFIGAVPITPATSAHIGQGQLFAMEGDEYPASNTDPRSKFLLLKPAHVLATPLAHDHFNIFPTTEDYLKPFYELTDMLPKTATLVVATSGQLSRVYIDCIKHKGDMSYITYGVAEGDYHADNIKWGERTSFDIVYRDEKIVRVETSQLGEHNVENIIGVAALLFTREWVSAKQFAEAISSFKGVVRRMDRKSEKTSIPIFEGFGSSYEKAQSAIAAMRLHFPSNPLRVVFEPNTIGWRARASLVQYDDAFDGASQVYVFNPPHDGKQTELTTEEIVARVVQGGTPAQAVHTPQEALEAITRDLDDNDCILLLSSGPMGGLVESIPKLCEQRFPA
jgi:UDP-N-acetylmuramate: L-alanyl-gamma-D-glutamyl-meso-diaminopimelate ligase